MATETTLAYFPLQTFDKVRYADTDRQGHVNNAVFSTFLETGRVELLYDARAPLNAADSEFVIVKLSMEFRAEIRWPGTVQIGTRVTSVGRSSVKLEQVIFQEGQCAAIAETVIVLIDRSTRHSAPLPQDASANVARLLRTMCWKLRCISLILELQGRHPIFRGFHDTDVIHALSIDVSSIR